MNCKVILIALIGLTSLQSIESNETTTPSDIVNAATNVSIGESPTNSSVIEFFGANDENSTAVYQNVLPKPNITSKVEYNQKKKNKKYRINNYSRDPLQSNAQSPNPFVAGAPGSRGSRRPGSGVDPQIAQLLQNNPRLRLLAEQNPQIAQQILRNPRLLRDPRIASAIRSQLGNGGGGLLGLLPGGLGAALNPLGIGLGGGGGGQQGPLGGTGLNQNDRSNIFGAPRGSNGRTGNRNRANEENIGGGYYGNNGNYGNNQNNQNNQNNRNNNQNVNNEDNSGATDANNEGGQDYDNSGQGEEGDEGQGGEEGGEGGEGGEEGGDEGQEAQDPNQDPSNDPDIQQLQNLGGGAGDNFPEGLFPPGLLSKEDLNEIRKQQEKQAKDQAEKERQQQGGDQGGGGQDYDDGNVEEGDGGEGGEENPDGANEEGEENTTANEEPITTLQPTPAPPQVHRSNPNSRYRPEFGGVRQGSVNNPGVEYDEILDVNTPIVTPPSVNSVRPKGNSKINNFPPAIPVPGIPYRGQQPVQPYINPQTGYPQPVMGQGYGQQPQYQPIQYYPPYQPNYIPQPYGPQQYPPQQFAPHPQPQYVGQHPTPYPQQPMYPQTVPGQQHGYLPQQPNYNPYPQNPNVRGNQQGYNNPNQLTRGGQASDPNIANHKQNTIPHDDSEDTDDYDNQSAAPNQRFSGHNGRPFQQQPRIFSSSAQNTESSVAFNSTEPSVDSNKFNSNSNATYDDIRQRTQPFF